MSQHNYYDDQHGGLYANSPGLHQPPISPYHDESPTRHVQQQYVYDQPGYANAPTPPTHAANVNPFSDANAYAGGARAGHYTPTDNHSTRSGTTPGMDNFGMAAAGGGIAGIAAGVATDHARESGMQAARGMPSAGLQRQSPSAENPFIEPLASEHYGRPRGDEMRMDHYPAQPVYSDSPYKRYSSPWDPRVENDAFDPNDIEDDGDDGLGGPPGARRSIMPGAAAGGAAAGAAAGYGQVPGGGNGGFEKSAFLAEEAAKRKRKRIIFIILGIFALLCIAGAAAAAGILESRKNTASSPDGSDAGGLYDKNSPEVTALLNNDALKMLFPGMDYTPFNAQYPACLTNPPSQNNVTMDMAVLSQLTKTVRLYGTDCNQTDMVIQGFKQLGITDMKLWLGVWLDNNQTTNTRGMSAMFDILDRNGPDPFAGVIIGNEVLFRKDMTPTELASVVASVRSNFTEKKITLPIAVADLGDNWSKDGKDFINDVDVVMSNIHPFFAGQPADVGAGWAWDFWQNNDIALTAGTSKQNIISEVGWPSQGGNDCGVDSSGNNVNCTSSTQGAVAGIDEMNTFMEDFVCNSLKNKTDYFWFEAFDEPWKAQFNTPNEQWEDRWGLMTPDRQMKPNLNLPDCSGQRIS